jgi:alkylhydroperoxidase/carboxymuconolactone decarboxylase family protein YurZ
MVEPLIKEETMDERTRTIAGLAAATAANCAPCFDNFYAQALGLGLEEEVVEEAVDLAGMVKKQSHVVMLKNIDQTMAGKEEPEAGCCEGKASSCCG